MSDRVNSTGGNVNLQQLAEALKNGEIDKLMNQKGRDTTIPPADSQIPGQTTPGSGQPPTLPSPDKVVMDRLKNLSAESLMQLLGAEERQVTVKSGMATLKANAEKRKAEADERIKNLQEQLKKIEEQEKKSVFSKIFGWIGAIVSTIAGVAATVAGVMTGNPLLIAGGIMLAISGVDSIVQMSTGKGMFQRACEACGMKAETAAIVGAVMNMAFGLAGGICTGVGFYKAGTDLNTILKVVQTATAVIGAASSIGNGVVTIQSAKIQSDLLNLQADQKLIEAIMQRLNMMQELDVEHLRKILEKSEYMVEQTNKCVKGLNATATAVATGGKAPQLA